MDWIFGHCKCWIHFNNCMVFETLDGVGHSETTSRTDGFSIDGSVGSEESPFTLASYEDYDLRYLETHVSEPRILLLRDPFNLFASRLRKVRQYIDDPNATFACFDMISDRGLEMWKRYARAFLESDRYVRVDFNEWYRSPTYRQDTSERLGFAFNDKEFGSEKGWTHSGGSSFGGKPDPLNSYKHMENDEEYLSLFDDETFELAEKIYDFKPDFKWHRPEGYQETTNFVAKQAQKLSDTGSREKGAKILEQALKVFPGNSLLRQRLAFVQRVHLTTPVVK